MNGEAKKLNEELVFTGLEGEGLNFYEKLPVMDHFFDSTDPEAYHSVPADWFLALTDIVDSTNAVERNEHKSVNMLGAAPIAGMFKYVDRGAVPYTFGGDGAMMAIPPEHLENARKVLSTCRKIGKEAYNLDLRAAIIPVSYLHEKGKTLKTARFRVSDYYSQALFMGNGVRYAEQILKDPNKTRFNVEMLTDGDPAQINNLECRWQEIKNEGKEVITLLVKNNPNLAEQDDAYTQVLKKLRSIYGFDDKTNPVTVKGLKMHKWAGKMKEEIKIRTSGMGRLGKFMYAVTIQVQSLIGSFFMRIGFKGPKRDWGEYKTDFVSNSDHRKFNDMLCTVISGTTKQREELEVFLEELYQQKKLAYGMHITDSAIVTCMIFEYYHEHIHFVDGSKGGYVKAAKELKQRQKALKE